MGLFGQGAVSAWAFEAPRLKADASAAGTVDVKVEVSAVLAREFFKKLRLLIIESSPLMYFRIG